MTSNTTEKHTPVSGLPLQRPGEFGADPPCFGDEKGTDAADPFVTAPAPPGPTSSSSTGPNCSSNNTWLLSQQNTVQPRSLRIFAVARPIPDAAPVTIAMVVFDIGSSGRPEAERPEAERSDSEAERPEAGRGDGW